MIPRAFIILFFIILASMSAFAEYYEYVDKNGVKHFTDDLSEIPENQRKKISIYTSTQSSSQKQITPLDPPAPLPTLEDFAAQKAQLDEDYQRLTQKIDTLNEQKQTLGPEKFNPLAFELNQEINAYQTRVDAYEKQVIEHNKKVISDQNEKITTEDTPPE